MDLDTGKHDDVQWVAQCTHRLRQRWPHADVTTLEEVAAELARDEALRCLGGGTAAEAWLVPVSPRAAP